MKIRKWNGFTLAISIGQWGGFYPHSGFTKRICLGFVSITIIPMDLDVLIDKLQKGSRQ